MKAQTRGDTSSLEFMRGRRILEVNPDHPIIKDPNIYKMMAIALGGRRGRLEDGESEAASEDNSIGSDDSSVDTVETEVVESTSVNTFLFG
ncbi:hypothetical protein AgCh_000648 [Apium graveolens]